MRDLTASVVGWSWAMSLFGVRQTARLLAAPLSRREAAAAADAFEAVAWQTQARFGPSLQEAFQAGDSLQRDAVDLSFAVLPRNPLAPGDWLGAGSELFGQSWETARLWSFAGDERLAWRDIGNKVEVYRLVKRVAGVIGVPGRGEPFSLAELVERSYALEDYPALWAVEGLGHDYAQHFWQPGEAVSGLLRDPAALGIPAKSLLMLHAGIGLGFAQPLVARVPPDAPAEEVERVVAEVFALCRGNSLPGDEGAAYESLGLVARSFFPTLVRPLARAVERVAPELLGYYWHGAGRSTYFLPINFIPAGDPTWRPFEMALRETPDPTALLDLFAGLGWAFTMVDIQDPEIVARRVVGPHRDALSRTDAFSYGVATSLAMRADTTPGAALVEGYLGYRPGGGAGAAWEALVVRPAEAFLEREVPRLRSEARLGELFHYRPGVVSG
jgi:hypothetical protein